MKRRFFSPPLVSLSLSLIGLILLGLIFASPAWATTQKVQEISSAGYFPGDLPGPTQADEWRTTKIPCVPQDCGLVAPDGIALFRIEFEVPPDADLGGWALSRGRVWGAEEVYLNGKLVGGTGKIAEKYAQAWSIPRVYALESEHLKRGTNEVVFRVMDQGTPFGFAFDPVEIGSGSVLRQQSDGVYFSELLFQGITIVLCFAASVLLLFGIILGRLRAPAIYGILAVFVSSAISWTLTSVWFDLTPASTRVETVNFISVFGSALALVPFLLLGRPVRWVYWVSAIYVAATAYPLIFHFQRPLVAYAETLQAVYQFSLGCYGGTLLFMQGWQRRKWLQVGVAIGVFGSVGLVVVSAVWTRSYIYPLHEVVQCYVLIVLSLVAIGTLRERTLRVVSLQRRVLEIADEERRKLARELHDGIGQDLQAARMSIQLAARSASSEDDALQGLLKENVDNLGSSLDHLRALSRELHPDFANERPLKARLEHYAAQLGRLTGREMRLSWTGDEQGLSTTESSHLFRAIQEAVGNALRHGDDDVVEVEVSVVRQALVLKVTGGPSFDPKQSQGLGWQTLRERARLLGGDVTLSSEGERARVEIKAQLGRE